MIFAPSIRELAIEGKSMRRGPRVEPITLTMDDYGTHKTPSVKAWMARHPRFHAHFTPTSSSWLNQVERWFAALRFAAALIAAPWSWSRPSASTSSQQSQSHTFVWTKTADQILESIKRFRMRTSSSGH
jgi:hypothetical protein